jgi:N6-L-threonylcarbamoyladenine synthase
MYLLALETSCDETGVAILKEEKKKTKLLVNLLNSQIKIHRRFGGVIPEIAARKQLESLGPLIKLALRKARIHWFQISFIAVTTGPGLIPSLLVGVETARTLAYLLKKPLISVNHLEGHIYANWLTEEEDKIKFPLLALIISGGHTKLVLMKNHGHYREIGQTLDDAAGEALDKVGRLLGLSYPAGPQIARLAARGDPSAFNLPRPLINSSDFNFSFSGLKTAFLYLVQKKSKS